MAGIGCSLGWPCCVPAGRNPARPLMSRGPPPRRAGIANDNDRPGRRRFAAGIGDRTEPSIRRGTIDDVNPPCGRCDPMGFQLRTALGRRMSDPPRRPDAAPARRGLARDVVGCLSGVSGLAADRCHRGDHGQVACPTSCRGMPGRHRTARPVAPPLARSRKVPEQASWPGPSQLAIRYNYFEYCNVHLFEQNGSDSSRSSPRRAWRVNLQIDRPDPWRRGMDDRGSGPNRPGGPIRWTPR